MTISRIPLSLISNVNASEGDVLAYSAANYKPEYRTITKGTLTKSFISGETYNIDLNYSADPSPTVSVTKEVPQIGASSKGFWDVNTAGTNYVRYDTSYNTTLTPSTASANGTFTLGTGTFSNNDVGKQIEGNGGKAVLTLTDGSYYLVTAFNDANTISANDWSMFGTTFDENNGLQLASGLVAPNHDIFGDGSAVAVYFLEGNGNDELGSHNLSVNSPNYVTGKYGQGYQVTTTSHYLTYFGYPAHSSNEVTISCWVKSLDTTWSGAAVVWTWSAGTDEHHGLQFTVGDGILRMWDGSSSTASPAGTVPTQEWVHIAVSCTATAQDIYMNGVYQGSTTGSYSAHPISGGPWDIIFGQEPDSYTAGSAFGSFSGSQDLNGSIDSIRIFNRTITAQEALTLAEIDEPTTSTLLPTNQYHIATTNEIGQIDSTYWLDINSMTADQFTGDGEIYYAVSTDNHVTWKVIDDTEGDRTIVRLNSGSWEYNSNTTYNANTWTVSTSNSELGALTEALSTPQNRMNKSQLEAVTDPNHYTLEDSLDLMIALYSANNTANIAYSDGVSINYDAETLNKGAILGTDYDYDFPDSTTVRLTSNASQNLKIKIT